MQIRDFSLPSPYCVPTPSRSDCEERTADLQQAHQNSDWLTTLDILLDGPVDPAVKNAVLFDALANTDDTICALLLGAARRHGPLDAATDSQIFVMAAEKKHRTVVEMQLQFGLIQPWAIQAAIRIVEQTNDQHLDLLLRETKPKIH